MQILLSFFILFLCTPSFSQTRGSEQEIDWENNWGFEEKRDPVQDKKLGAGMKALLVVGHLEGSTAQAIEDMEKTRKVLEYYGVTCYRAYDKVAVWENIVKISPECDFFIYAGHGSTLGKDGNAGGICITSMVSTERLLKEFRLKDNALVIFKSVCGGAGSSASDTKDIGVAEARKRVGHYAAPFFEIGAAAYYADNYDGSAAKFLRGFFEGKSFKELFEKALRVNSQIKKVHEGAFPLDKSKYFCISSSPDEGATTVTTTYSDGRVEKKQVYFERSYSITCVGPAKFCLQDMKKQEQAKN